MIATNTGPRAMRADLRDPDLPVAEVMRTDFRSCNASTPAAEAATALRAARCAILAVTRAQVPIGALTEHGLAMALAEHGGDLSRMTAEGVMEGATMTIAMEATVEEALARFNESGGPLLAVDADGLLKGVVTLAELGPQLSEPALGRLVARLAGAHGPRSPSQAARAADPTAEVESSKSQAQPHPWDSPTGDHPQPVPLVSPADLVNPMLSVADAMTASPRTCSPQSSLVEASLIFRDADCGAVPVTEAGKPVGILTDRDVALAAADRDGGLAGATVGDLMTRGAAEIAADASLADAIRAFGEHGVRRLLVVDEGGMLAGILSWTDLIGHVSERGLGRVVAAIEGRRG